MRPECYAFDRVVVRPTATIGYLDPGGGPPTY